MLRCALIAATFTVCVSAAVAQAPRNFPASALRGEVVITAPPELLLNKQPARLAPGARIRAVDNLLVMSGAAVNQRMVVNYTLDLQGQLLDVWILSAAEMARKPWPATPQEAATWRFNPDAQVWSKP